jgi:hypothetical protein
VGDDAGEHKAETRRRLLEAATEVFLSSLSRLRQAGLPVERFPSSSSWFFG